MKLLNAMVLAVVLLLPRPAYAQSVKLADLVGGWVPVDTDTIGPKKDTLVIRSDSTSNWFDGTAVNSEFGAIHRLSGDTIAFVPNGRAFHVTRTDQQIILKARDVKGKDMGEYTFKRAAAPTPKP